MSLYVWGMLRYDALARYIRIVEVSGSNPLCSTTIPLPKG